VHARDIRFRVAEERTHVVVRVERREQRRQGRTVRPDKEPEESQPQVENTVGPG